MLRGGVVLVTAAMSVLFLKRKLQAFNYWGCFFVTLGIGIVGSANFLFPEKDSSESKNSSL